ncbi:tannase/feruloyl esterase family alpha/beta hydrolase [Burkholderia pseudomultivorans]
MLAGCGGDDTVGATPTHLSAATPAAMTQTCDALAEKLAYPGTSFTTVTTAAAGALTVAGKPIAEHCVIEGRMNERVSPVDGMNHCSGGPAADQFDLLTPLVAWVEQGQAPAAIVATARDATSAAPNADVPASWGAGRTRPLCPYPQVARYNGSGDLDSAANFSCR